MTHSVILRAVGLRRDLSSRVLIRELSVVIHSSELHEELVGPFLVAVKLSDIATCRHSLPFGCGNSKELLGTLGATARLLLLQIPEKSGMLDLVKFRLQ